MYDAGMHQTLLTMALVSHRGLGPGRRRKSTYARRSSMTILRFALMVRWRRILEMGEGFVCSFGFIRFLKRGSVYVSVLCERGDAWDGLVRAGVDALGCVGTG